MKVLFIYRSKGRVSDPIVSAQINSLKSSSIKIFQLEIKKGGFNGYYNAIKKAIKISRKNQIDIIHGHYLYCGIIAIFVRAKIKICSLMGSDVLNSKFEYFLSKRFSKYFWDGTIVKSKEMHKKIPLSKVIPNGVDCNNFFPIEYDKAINKTNFDKKYFNIIFAAFGSNATYAKNVSLAEKALELVNSKKIILHKINNIPHSEMKYFYSAANLLLFTSRYEGSPNVIKEAMACNCPIISTNVGDVKEIINYAKFCYISDNHDPHEISNYVKKLLEIGYVRTNGFSKIQHLESKQINYRIIDFYRSLMFNK